MSSDFEFHLASLQTRSPCLPPFICFLLPRQWPTDTRRTSEGTVDVDLGFPSGSLMPMGVLCWSLRLRPAFYCSTHPPVLAVQISKSTACAGKMEGMGHREKRSSAQLDGRPESSEVFVRRRATSGSTVQQPRRPDTMCCQGRAGKLACFPQCDMAMDWATDETGRVGCFPAASRRRSFVQGRPALIMAFFFVRVVQRRFSGRP